MGRLSGGPFLLIEIIALFLVYKAVGLSIIGVTKAKPERSGDAKLKGLEIDSQLPKKGNCF